MSRYMSWLVSLSQPERGFSCTEVDGMYKGKWGSGSEVRWMEMVGRRERQADRIE